MKKSSIWTHWDGIWSTRTPLGSNVCEVPDMKKITPAQSEVPTTFFHISHDNWSSSLTSVSQDALDAVLGPPLVVLQLFLLHFLFILLIVAFPPELTPHAATDGAHCKSSFKKWKITNTYRCVFKIKIKRMILEKYEMTLYYYRSKHGLFVWNKKAL